MSKTYTIVALKGDGIGPEVTEATVKVLEAVEKKSNFKLNIVYGEAGAHCIPQYGTNLPQKPLSLSRKATHASKAP